MKEEAEYMYEAKMFQNTLIVSIRIELDEYSVKRIRERVDSILVYRQIHNIIFDLSEMGFMDSAGIGLLLGRYRQIKERSGKCGIVTSNSYVLRILKMSGILHLFSHYRSVEDGLKQFEKTALA